jgi:hypothetical protein
MDVCLFCVCCVLSGRGLCDELITLLEESYRLWRVAVCDQENSCYEEAIARVGLQSQKKNRTEARVLVNMYVAVLCSTTGHINSSVRPSEAH